MKSYAFSVPETSVIEFALGGGFSVKVESLPFVRALSALNDYRESDEFYQRVRAALSNFGFPDTLSDQNLLFIWDRMIEVERDLAEDRKKKAEPIA